jgi:DNA-binding response OmpR family regulator
MGGRVLVIDDSEVIRHAARRGLEAAGWEVAVADGGAAGLAAARSAPPDVILLDLVMPDVNGADVLDALEADASPVPVILLTSSADATQLADRVAGIISKPFSPAGLDGRVRGVLDGVV